VTFFSSPPYRNRLWGPLSHLFSGCRGLLPRGKATGAWSLPLISI